MWTEVIILPFTKGAPQNPALASALGGPRLIIGFTWGGGAPRKRRSWSKRGSRSSIEGGNLGAHWSPGETLSAKEGTSPRKGAEGNQDSDRNSQIQCDGTFRRGLRQIDLDSRGRSPRLCYLSVRSHSLSPLLLALAHPG